MGSGRVQDLGPWIGRLAAIGKAEPELRDDIYKLIEAMQQLPAQAGQSAATRLSALPDRSEAQQSHAQYDPGDHNSAKVLAARCYFYQAGITNAPQTYADYELSAPNAPPASVLIASGVVS